MKRLTDLRFMFTVVAAIETVYALLALLTPPSMVTSITGWILTADGQWLAKLMGVALGAQAWIAWTLRKQPHLGVAGGLAFYQLGSATVDWLMWLALAGDGIFSTPLGRFWTGASIATHYTIGLLLVLAIRRSSDVAGRERAAVGQLPLPCFESSRLLAKHSHWLRSRRPQFGTERSEFNSSLPDNT